MMSLELSYLIRLSCNQQADCERNDFRRESKGSTSECELPDKQYSDFGHSVLPNHIALIVMLLFIFFLLFLAKYKGCREKAWKLYYFVSVGLDTSISVYLYFSKVITTTIERLVVISLFMQG